MVIKKAVYVWVIGILGMISFAACSSASQGESLRHPMLRWIIFLHVKVCGLI